MNLREVVVLGVGVHKFGRFPEKSYVDLARVAILEALKDANVSWRDIQSIYCGSALAGPQHGSNVVKEMGRTGISIVNVETYCISGLTAARLAYLEVASGARDIAMAVGYEKQERGFIPAYGLPDWSLRMGLGAIPCFLYAPEAMRRIHEYGWKPEHLAMVSVKAHKMAALTPYSHYPMPNLTVEEVLAADTICDPLTMLMMSPPSDGGAAAVICAKDVAHKFNGSRKMVSIASIVQSSEGGKLSRGKAASTQAYENAGIGPEDVDVAFAHDATALTEMLSYEEALFCKEGEGARLIEDGTTLLGGRIPCNTWGGLLGGGNAVAACGLHTLAELVWQLRGEAGPRQVPHPNVAFLLSNALGGHAVSAVLKT